MATLEDKIDFLKRWYDGSVTDIESFRANDPAFSGPNAVGKLGGKPIEGQPKTYPAGYTNQSLNQKAQRYINMMDSKGRNNTNPKWKPPFPGAVNTDSKGKMEKDSKDQYVGKVLKSKNKSQGGKRGQWTEDAFAGWKPGKFTNS